MRLTVIDLWRYERSTMYRAIPHLSPIGLSVIHQADEKHVECYIPTLFRSLFSAAASSSRLRKLEDVMGLLGGEIFSGVSIARSTAWVSKCNPLRGSVSCWIGA